MCFISGEYTQEKQLRVFRCLRNTAESRLRRARLEFDKEMFDLAEDVISVQKVDQQFSQRVKAKIKAMTTIDIHVTDLRKSLHFYVDLLGFQLVRPPFHTDQNVEDNAIIRIEGGPNIILVMKPHTEIGGGSSIVFTYHTDEIDVLHSVMKHNGVRTNERYDDGCGKWFECYDPDGNMVYVHAD
jgi:predicted enzyme related to lactoylglutathione lyase